MSVCNAECGLQLLNKVDTYLLYLYWLQWENHAKSLKLEEQTLNKIKCRIDDKVMKSSGTWIDWQYLLQAADLLKKARQSASFSSLI